MCERFVRCTYRDGEPAEDRALKQIVIVPCIVISVITGTLCVLYVYAVGEGMNSYNAGLLICTLGLMVPVTYTCVTKVMRAVLFRIGLIVCVIGVVLLDWRVSATPGAPRAWTFNVLVIDCLLVVNASARWTSAAVTMTLLWLVIQCSEETWRWGLFRIDGWSTPYDEVIQRARDCEDPPCPISVTDSMARLTGYVLVFLVDFSLTRGFAAEMRAQMAAVESSVLLAEELSVMLSLYDTDAARSLVDGEQGMALPRRLQEAMRQLADNLCQYRPFLPQSCLPQAQSGTGCSDSGEETWTTTSRVSPTPSDSAGRSVAGTDVPTPRADRRPSRRLPEYPRALSMPQVTADLEALSASCSAPPTLPARCQSSQIVTHKASQLSHSVNVHGLRRKEATVIVANLRSYLTAAEHAPPGTLLQFHDDTLTRFVHATTQAKAITDGMSADRFFASVNGARPCVNHRAVAVRLAWRLSELPDIRRRSASLSGDGEAVDSIVAAAGMTAPSFDHVLTSTQSECSDSGGALFMLECSAGVASGEMLCGNVGCDQIRRFTFVGAAATWAYALERLATQWCAPVVVNGHARADAAVSFTFRLREVARMDKRAYPVRPTSIWELISAVRDADAAEWMYQLQQQQAADFWEPYNRVREALATKGAAAAEPLLRDAKQNAAQRPQSGSPQIGRPLAPALSDYEALEALLLRAPPAGPAPPSLLAEATLTQPAPSRQFLRSASSLPAESARSEQPSCRSLSDSPNLPRQASQ